MLTMSNAVFVERRESATLLLNRLRYSNISGTNFSHPNKVLEPSKLVRSQQEKQYLQKTLE